MKKVNIGEYTYMYKEIEVDWSEGAVEYTLYDKFNRKIKTDQCEEHMLGNCVKNDIENVITYKNTI